MSEEIDSDFVREEKPTVKWYALAAGVAIYAAPTLLLILFAHNRLRIGRTLRNLPELLIGEVVYVLGNCALAVAAFFILKNSKSPGRRKFIERFFTHLGISLVAFLLFVISIQMIRDGMVRLRDVQYAFGEDFVPPTFLFQSAMFAMIWSWLEIKDE